MNWFRAVLCAFAVAAFPTIASADPLPEGHIQLGGQVQGGLTSVGGNLILSGLATYTVHDWIAVGVDGGGSVVGIPFWRAGGLVQFFVGGEFLRPFAQIRLEAMEVYVPQAVLAKTPGSTNSATFGLGFEIGMAWQPNDRLAVVPAFGFDGDFRVHGASVGEFGVSVQYLAF